MAKGRIPLFCCLLLLAGGLHTAVSTATSSFKSERYGDNAMRVRHVARVHRELARSYGQILKPTSEPVDLFLDMEGVLYEVDPEFLSVTIDALQAAYNWNEINFTAPRIINMAKGLNPAMLRVGGTNEDFLLFNMRTGAFSAEKDTNFTMTTAQWDAVNEFVKTVGWEFIFGLNSLLRNPYPVGVWDSTNAAQLMSYSTSKGYTVNWELGNEPDLWNRHGYNITTSEHAKDFTVLKELVEKEKPLGKLIVGPDVADNPLYFGSFLKDVEKGTLSATTYHHHNSLGFFVNHRLWHSSVTVTEEDHSYYANGQSGTLPQFYDVNLLDTFIRYAIDFRGISEVLAPDANLWIGETSSMYNNGAPHLSDTYVAGFMWLDKLGIAAVVGHERVFRQDFVGGNYSLLDSDQNPLPDYWLSVLHKKLVGTKVLYVLGSLEDGRHLRAYAHCAKTPYPAGSVVMLLLNMNFSSVSAHLVNAELASSSRDVYWLTPPSGNLTSTSVQLNGQLLQLVDNTELPDLKPEEQAASSTITLPPISFGFYVFKDTKAPACM